MKNNKLSIEFDDDDKDYKSFNEFMNNHTNRRKNSFLKEINDSGVKYLKEIDKKKKKRNKKKMELIPYILENSKIIEYDEDELLLYEYVDVLEIYNKVKKENRSLFSKVLHFIFNLD